MLFRSDRVLLLLQRRYRGNDEHIEVLMASAVLAHQLQQLLDVAGPDVDDSAGDGLQVLLQVGELPSADGLRLARGGVQTFDADQVRTFDARPTVMQNVLDLSLLSRIRAARTTETAYKYDAQTAKEATLLAVLQIYLQIQQADSRIAAAEARRNTANAVLEQARQFEQAGTASKLDVARASQQFHSEQAILATAKGEREALATLLLRTIGMPQQEVALEAPGLELKLMAQAAEIGRASCRERVSSPV